MRLSALAVAFLALTLAWAPSSEAVSCLNVSDITALGSGGCDLGGLIFENFNVSASAGFTDAKIGLGNNSTVVPGNVNLVFQLAATNNQTPPSAIGPGDVLLSYGVRATSGLLLTGIDVTNDGIGAVTIGEIACRTPFSFGGTCAPENRLAELVALPGQSVAASFGEPVAFAFLHKDLAVGVGGFLSDFSNSHAFDVLAPVPEPTTLLLFSSVMAGLGWKARRRLKK